MCKRRVRHCQHRKVFQEVVAHGGTAAVAEAAALGATFNGGASLNFNAAGGNLGCGGTELHR